MTTPDQPRWSSRPARAHKIRARATPAGVATTTEKVPPSGPVPSTRSTNPSRSAWAIPCAATYGCPSNCCVTRSEYATARNAAASWTTPSTRSENSRRGSRASCSRRCPVRSTARLPSRRSASSSRSGFGSRGRSASRSRPGDGSTSRSIFMLPTPFPGSGVTRERDPIFGPRRCNTPLGHDFQRSTLWSSSKSPDEARF